MWDWELYFYILRVVHIFAGITWIGILYYFNFIQVPAFARMDPAARSNAVINLVPLALVWFRYAALATVLAGLLYIMGAGLQASGVGEGGPFLASGSAWDYFRENFRFRAVAIGGTLGIIMLFNVWVIIWPNQKKIIAATRATVLNQTPAPPDQPKWARRALLASRTNTLLSIPMLFFMVGAIHLGQLWS